MTSIVSFSNQDAPERLAFGQSYTKDCWYFAALSTDLKPGRLQRYTLLDEPILLARDMNGKVFALRDICPHRAAPLSKGALTTDPKTGDCVVACPYHGWTFNTCDGDSGNASGTCASIPSLSAEQKIVVEKIRVRPYDVREQQGLVWVYMTTDRRFPEAPDHEPPLIPGTVGRNPLFVETMDFDSHIDHAVVGLMDPAHGPYVHQQWWWRSSKNQMPKSKAFEPSEHGFTMIRHAPSSNSRIYKFLGGKPETEITFRLPGIRYEHIRIGQRQILALTFMTPLTHDKARMTQIFWSDHGIFRAISPFFRLGAKAFLRQDSRILSLQSEGLTHTQNLIWIDDADTQAKWYMALKREWAKARSLKEAFVNPIKATVLKWTSGFVLAAKTEIWARPEWHQLLTVF
ncbi:Rieske 2Fe-2S domain-containing protein [Asticcacaulis sp.]|uniref:Rieske 2Fe-2S domain-containing protein n=1 Tax=Asticcacaulis sp. TaxID=1872648 RepID=UPI00391CEB34